MNIPAMFVAFERRLAQEGHDDLRLGFAAFGAGFAAYAGEMWRLTFGMRKRIGFSFFFLGKLQRLLVSAPAIPKNSFRAVSCLSMAPSCDSFLPPA